MKIIRQAASLLLILGLTATYAPPVQSQGTPTYSVGQVAVTYGGCYSSATPPPLVFNGTATAQPTATATMKPSSCSGGYQIAAVTLSYGGAGYTAAPRITATNTAEITVPTFAVTMGPTPTPPPPPVSGGSTTLTNGTNTAGTIAFTGTDTTATLTFSAPWPTWAACTANFSVASQPVAVNYTGTTAATFTIPTANAGTLSYACAGQWPSPGSTPATTPTFSPVAGSYSSASVTISAAAGSVICYNATGAPHTNGSTNCTAGTLYTGAVYVSSTETLYAVAGGAGYSDSAVASAAYTFQAPAFSSYTYSQPASGNYSSITTAGAGGAQTVAVGNLVGIYVMDGTNNGPSSCGDSLVGNSYTATTYQTNTASPAEGQFFWSQIATGGSANWTCTGTYTNPAMSVIIITGLSSTAATDVVKYGVTTSASTTLTIPTTGTFSTTQRDLVLTCLAAKSNGTDFWTSGTVGTGNATTLVATSKNTAAAGSTQAYVYCTVYTATGALSTITATSLLSDTRYQVGTLAAFKY